VHRRNLDYGSDLRGQFRLTPVSSTGLTFYLNCYRSGALSNKRLKIVKSTDYGIITDNRWQVTVSNADDDTSTDCQFVFIPIDLAKGFWRIQSVSAVDSTDGWGMRDQASNGLLGGWFDAAPAPIYQMGKTAFQDGIDDQVISIVVRQPSNYMNGYFRAVMGVQNCCLKLPPVPGTSFREGFNTACDNLGYYNSSAGFFSTPACDVFMCGTCDKDDIVINGLHSTCGSCADKELRFFRST
jgi:hypothetical protein